MNLDIRTEELENRTADVEHDIVNVKSSIDALNLRTTDIEQIHLGKCTKLQLVGNRMKWSTFL